MKAKVLLQAIVGYVWVACVCGQYPPSGYRPPGRQFDLPQGFGTSAQPQGQHGPPQNQYGAPNPYEAPSGSVASPSDQYLPATPQTDVRFNQGSDGNQQDYFDQTEQQQNPNFGQNMLSSSVRNRNYQQATGPKEKSNDNIEQNQFARQRLYEAPSKQRDDDFNNDDQEFNANNGVTRSRINGGSQNYLPPTSTERRRYLEPTTASPATTEPEDTENSDVEDPNIAFATAVARGQYYLLQPDGRLQRVVYKTTEDLKNSQISAKLVYQDVNPITAPIYTYNEPLIRVN